MINIDKIKQLRKETGISISKCRNVLEEAEGDIEKAKEILRKMGEEFAKKKEERETKEGIIESYIHPNKRIGAMVKLRCESDFVARSDEFKKLAHELCLQIAAVDPEETPLKSQPWIKDESRTIGDLINEYIAKLGENIVVEKFTRYKL